MERSYNQYCATARTLDIVGERWTLLLIRELLTGPKRFSDLQRNLRGLGTGLLSARMRNMESQGLVRRITLPPPARTPAYALTPAGEELGPVVLSLARWGLKWAMEDPRDEEAFHPGWAVLGLHVCFQPEAAAGLRVTYEFRVGDETFHTRVHDGTLDTVHGPAQYPDAVITTDERTFRDVTAGKVTLGGALESGTASASGDPGALRALPALFVLPARRCGVPERRGPARRTRP
ncbi:winged helix-turn-helix transcriptional regulator [Nonomuraea sp. NPDC050783]|uniref:winged helix-turn-helix transcriptional regulator n=1 Tax=Nonomuraea sp. NPDC050783 TaxID=3154634 RepID=UPI00346533FB